jgi:hypothetical protein
MDRLWFIGLLVSGLISGGAGVAQKPRPSQHGTVGQEIGGTRVTIEYNRPVARGRELFGALVPWRKVWCPGADTCTSLAVSTDIQVNGQKLAAGTYSVWAEPGEERWTWIFSRAHPVWHTRYDEAKDALRVTVTPREGHHMETLAFYFPAVDGKRAELVLHWGRVVVPLQLEVP